MQNGYARCIAPDRNIAYAMSKKAKWDQIRFKDFWKD